MIEERIQVAKQYVKTLFADRADGHDVAHTLRVYTNAMRIAQAEVHVIWSCLLYTSYIIGNFTDSR